MEIYSIIIFMQISYLYHSHANIITSRIVNGHNVNIRDFPFVVSIHKVKCTIGRIYRHHCGGNIISKAAVLSAAHCIAGNKINQFSIHAGSSLISKGFKTYSIKTILTHPNHRAKFWDYDFGILFPEKEFQFGDSISAIPISYPGYQLADEAPVTVLGWGKFEYKKCSKSSNILQAAEVSIINHRTCKRRYSRLSNLLTDAMICAGSPRPPIRDACIGDSGGPLVHDGVLVGLVSWGHGCADPRYPGVYASVSIGYDWIVNKTRI